MTLARRTVLPRSGSPTVTKPANQYGWLLEPPAILGAAFTILFGVGLIDALYGGNGERLRKQLVFYHGLSWPPVLYLIATYACFVGGYVMKPAASFFRQLRPGPRQWDSSRVSVVTTISFAITFGVLVAYTMQVGYGRFEGAGNEAFENLSLLGELSLIPCAFSLVRYFQQRSTPGRRMSRWDRVFLWGCMLPAQVILSLVVETRSRVVTFIVLTLVAYHYSAKQLRARGVIIAGVVTLAILVPVLGNFRLAGSEEFSFEAAWESLARRTSAIESLTIIYENLDSAPDPDPFYWTLLTGLVPRFLWPGKPQSLATERLTYWAIGQRGRWAGPTLPGEFMMLFGYGGGLVAMALLGVFWRFLREVSRLGEGGPWTVLYVVAVPTLLTVEVGFVSPYSVLTRFMVVTAILFFVSTGLSKARSIQRPGAAQAPGIRRPLLTTGVSGRFARER